MDFEMRNYYDSETEDAIWDFSVKDGNLQVIDHETSEQQRAVIAAFIQQGTVPGLEQFGVQWAELLTSQVTPQQINAQIRNSISSVIDGMKFSPKYSMSNGKLVVEIKAVQ